jgi:hypothetical protein
LEAFKPVKIRRSPDWHNVPIRAENRKRACQPPKTAGITKQLNSKGFRVIISKKQVDRQTLEKEARLLFFTGLKNLLVPQQKTVASPSFPILHGL